MHISSTLASATGQLSGTSQRRPQGAPLASALKSLGVEESKAAKILDQVHEAVDKIQSTSASGFAGHAAHRSAVEGVLEANGIDPAEVGAAIQSSKSQGPPPGSGPQRGGPPGGRPPKGGQEKGGSIESALRAANVDESEIESLLNQLIETVSALSTQETSATSFEEAIRSALTEVLDDIGVDSELFEGALQTSLGESGSFFDQVA